MQKITPFLWFNNQAEEAAHFYVAVFGQGKILNIARYGEAGPGPASSAMVVEFELFGMHLTALNGGPGHEFSDAFSFVIDCDTQEEIDRYWDQLTDNGGEEVQCGWLKDKYGLSWQIVPTVLSELLSGDEPAKTAAATKAMLSMKKLDIKQLQEAYDRA